MTDTVDKSTAWDMLIAAREDEREKCAKIAENFPQFIATTPGRVRQIYGADIAKAIRAMKTYGT